MISSSDILIIGGGIIGLSIAIELKLRGAIVTVLCRDFQETATRAAAGMLAPQAEGISPSPMLDLCLRSRSLYPEWVSKLEVISGLTAEYWSCGILAPVYDRDPEATWSAKLTANSQWLDRPDLQQRHPGVSSEVVGGYWYPLDAQVDNRALYRVLRTTAEALNIEVREETVHEITAHKERVLKVKTSSGDRQADRYLLATGAWSSDFLPIPVQPRKGQMLSVRVSPPGETIQPLQTVLFGTEVYIIPRRDGRILIGATSEKVGFTPGNTPAGIQSLLTAAMRLYPSLKDYPIQEFWWGFRPDTPDELPILGPSPWDNLTLATGHYRNGILLAPITASLISDWIEEKDDGDLLPHFSYTRFRGN